jgi:hypothetical protein
MRLLDALAQSAAPHNPVCASPKETMANSRALQFSVSGLDLQPAHSLFRSVQKPVHRLSMLRNLSITIREKLRISERSSIMHKLLMLTVLFLFVAAAVLPRQATKAEVAPVQGSECTAAKVKEAAAFSVYLTCQSACEDELDDYLNAANLRHLACETE